MADTQPPGGDAPLEPADKPDWWSSTEQSPLSKLGTTAARPSARPPGSESLESSTPPVPTRSLPVDSTYAGWSVALLVGSGAIVAGSLSTWLSIKTVFGSRGVTGVSDADLGWVTLIAAIVIAAAAVSVAVWPAEAASRRFFSLVAGAAAGASFAMSIFTLIEQPSGQGASVGWGLILVFLGSIVALGVSLALNVSDA